jgi:N-sulfoglucosamine sulfohydrolase
MKTSLLALVSITLAATLGIHAAAQGRPNILMLTADDMNFDSVGYMGCPLPGITPQLDALAAQGMVFHHAYAMSPVCGPSRAAIHSGRYPHSTGQMGHGKMPTSWWPTRPQLPTISSYLHEHGYRTGILCKGAGGDPLVNVFDLNLGKPQTDVGRSPEKFYNICKDFFEEAKSNDQPFFMNANFCDPHAPWARRESEGWLASERKSAEDAGESLDIPQPGTRYSPDEIPVPPFLLDDPEVRADIAPYFDSVHRMDRCAGAVLKALDESGLRNNTIILFLADHGMGVTFAKRSNYEYGARTPLFFVWPGQITSGINDQKHMVSVIDIMPTLIEAVGLPPVKGLDGHSLYPILKGESPDDWRTHVYAAFNCMNGEREYTPTRAIIGLRHLYMWNSWADGKTAASEVLHGHDVNKEAHFKARWGDDWEFGPTEEFYDLRKDPGFWSNQVKNPELGEEVERFREQLALIMETSDDHELPNFIHRHDPSQRVTFDPDPAMVIEMEMKHMNNKIEKAEARNLPDKNVQPYRDALAILEKKLDGTSMPDHDALEERIEELLAKKKQFEKHSEGWNRYKTEISPLKKKLKEMSAQD